MRRGRMTYFWNASGAIDRTFGVPPGYFGRKSFVWFSLRDGNTRKILQTKDLRTNIANKRVAVKLAKAISGAHLSLFLLD
jgi:hypothetical protein